MKINKISKGKYKYIEYNKKYCMLKAAAGLSVIIIIFIAGLIITKTRLNWFTFAAVLLAMPAGRAVVNAIMTFSHSSMQEAAFNRINELSNGDIEIIYDLVITSYEGAVQIDSVFVKGNTICAYSTDKKIDIDKTSKYIKDMLVNNGVNVSIKIYESLDKYIERIKEINQNLDNESRSDAAKERDKNKQDKIISTLLAISL